VRGLACAIDRRPIVSGIEFDVEPGSFVAVVGPNGCGKSTMLRTIAGVLPKQGGDVLLDGRPAESMKPPQRARRLALVGQHDAPSDDQLVEEVVTLGRLPHRSPWSLGNRRDREAVRDALAQVGLRGFERRQFARLSGGEQRRVLIARGLAQQTDLLLLDEPTNHLDIGHQHNLLAQVRETGHTVVAALHDLNLATSYADEVVVLARGRMIARGATRDVLSSDLIQEVFEVRSSAVTDPETGTPQWVFGVRR
jgi:iron complex transport system ATP-binding protein